MEAKRFCVIGVDPGKITGLASYSWEIVPNQDNQLDSFDASCVPATAIIGRIRDLSRIMKITHIFCEPYIIGQRTTRMTQQTHAMEIIGALKVFCAEEINAKFVPQQQSISKIFGNKDRLKQFGWYTSNDSENHANDAASQVLLGLAAHYPRLFLSLLDNST